MSATNMSPKNNMYTICPNHSVCINGDGMPIYESLATNMWQGVLYTDDNDIDADADTDASDDNATWLN